MITWEDIVPKIVLSQTNMEGSQRKYRSQRRFYGKSIVGKWKRNRKTLDEPSEVCDIQCPARKGNWKDQILRRKGHWSWKLEIPRLCNSIRTRRMYKEKNFTQKLSSCEKHKNGSLKGQPRRHTGCLRTEDKSPTLADLWIDTLCTVRTIVHKKETEIRLSPKKFLSQLEIIPK